MEEPVKYMIVKGEFGLIGKHSLKGMQYLLSRISMSRFMSKTVFSSIILMPALKKIHYHIKKSLRSHFS